MTTILEWCQERLQDEEAGIVYFTGEQHQYHLQCWFLEMGMKVSNLELLFSDTVPCIDLPSAALMDRSYLLRDRDIASGHNDSYN